MPLELLTLTPPTTPRRTPLLFIHGAWQAAWCWAEHLMPYFVAENYATYALSLRGHGNSPGREHLRTHRIADYVRDVEQVAAQLPAPPIIIAHSMGGLVAQKYLESHAAPTAVLLASVPVQGALGAALRTARRIPGPFLWTNLTLSLYPLIGTPDRARGTLFSRDLPSDLLQLYFPRFQDESYLAFLDMIFSRPRPDRVKSPVLVLGAADDAIFTPAEMHATARAYNTTAHIFPHMAHQMMLESPWASVASHILAWLQQHNF